MFVPQSPEGTPVSVQDRLDPTPFVTELPISACLVEFPEPTTLPASSGAVRQVNRETIVDSSDDEVPSLLGSTLWDSQTSNAIVGPTAETVHGQTVFGHPYLTIFGQSILGQSIFGHRVLGPINFGQIQSNLGQSHFGQSIWIWKAAGVPHDNLRAQTCTFEGPGLHKNHQNSTGRPPRERNRAKLVVGDGKKAEILGCPAEGGPPEGVRRKVVQTNNHTTTRTTTTNDTNNETHNNTQQQHKQEKTTT